MWLIADDETSNQDLNIDSKSTTITFKIHGGRSQVKLIRTYNMETVRVQVRWDVRDCQGEHMRIEISDQEGGPWGFIGAGMFQVQ